MATQVLAGSTGKYTGTVINGFDVFTVQEDTCMECENIPVKFVGESFTVKIQMKFIQWINIKTSDF